jgi:NADPH:quinone reductase-like Zn-dependent oxidoreductase
MKAVFFAEHGGPEVLQYGEVPDPVAGAGQVVVDVYAASVNGADWRVRADTYRQAPPSLPHILGRDFSGVVSVVGEGADLALGDPVFGVCDNAGGVTLEGAYAEKIAMNARILARKPDTLSHVEAAAIALIGLTAVVSIEDTLDVKPEETILIQGGAGGVGGFAVQLAKHIGARVITTASAANHTYVRQLGADEVIDYDKVDFVDVVSDCDAVFDTVGVDVIDRCYTVLKPGGRVASIAVGSELPPTSRDDIVRLRPSVHRDRPHLERVIGLVESRAVTLPEITVYPLKEASAAHRVSEGRHLRGKLVLAVR